MAEDLEFSCRCGALRGVLHGASPTRGCHLVCYCRDCRAFARHLGVSDDLEPGGGAALFQTVPAFVEITQGAEHIACKRLSEKGLHRWYASCCNTPLANTMSSPRVPFAGLWRPLFARTEPLGPVVARGFTKRALPGQGAPQRDSGLGRMIGSLLTRTAAAYLRGNVRRSPFFDTAGQPVAVPVILTEAERRAAYAE